MNILIIEPSNAYALLLSKLLESEETNVDIARSAQEAIEKLKKNTPNAICVAHELGDSDSHQFMVDISGIASSKDIPKFLITSITTQDFKRHCYDIGYTDIFYKDNIKALQRALKGLVQQTYWHINAKILYIEDVPSTAAYTIAIMNQVNWEVDHVHTGEEAIISLYDNDNSYDLVITDLILPGHMSGLALISDIRESKSEYIRNIPIIAISGWNDLLRQVFVLQHGANDFVSKPFKENDFLARALNLIQMKHNNDKLAVQQKILFDRAHTDKLTGLNNRHGFDESAHRVISKTLKQGLPVTLLMIDLDHFKKINDHNGHKSGDTVLAQIGILLKGFSRQDDLAVRYGGEEFILLLPECSRDNGALKAEKLRKDIENLNPLGISITASIGFSTVTPDNPQNVNWLLSNADKGMYEAKESGRNQTVFYD